MYWAESVSYFRHLTRACTKAAVEPRLGWTEGTRGKQPATIATRKPTETVCASVQRPQRVPPSPPPPHCPHPRHPPPVGSGGAWGRVNVPPPFQRPPCGQLWKLDRSGMTAEGQGSLGSGAGEGRQVEFGAASLSLSAR